MARPLPKLGTKLGVWLRRNDTSIADLARSAKLAYRTCWLATHGVRVSFKSAELISAATRREVSAASLCGARARARASAGGAQ